MATYSKHLLSGSTNGKNISVTGTSTGASVTVHTATSGTSNLDEIWLYAANTSAAAVVLTVEFGGTTDQDDLIELEIAADSGMSEALLQGIIDAIRDQDMNVNVYTNTEDEVGQMMNSSNTASAEAGYRDVVNYA